MFKKTGEKKQQVKKNKGLLKAQVMDQFMNTVLEEAGYF